ncbi:hypothetical protein [Azospirillum argentinense]
MANSLRYRKLDKRLKALRQRFLPKAFSPTGVYTQFALDKARAFRVLSHAEIEHYFEEEVTEIADRALASWINQQRACIALLHLVCNIAGELNGLPKKIGTNTNATSIVGKAVNQYKYNIRNNHGIKSANILQLLLPVGVNESDIDQVWLNVMDGFGQKRGQSAHTSHISYTIDPKDDHDIIFAANGILHHIKDIDEKLQKIKDSIP